MSETEAFLGTVHQKKIQPRTHEHLSKNLEFVAIFDGIIEKS